MYIVLVSKRLYILTRNLYFYYPEALIVQVCVGYNWEKQKVWKFQGENRFFFYSFKVKSIKIVTKIFTTEITYLAAERM